jgi:hypothetical protein
MSLRGWMWLALALSALGWWYSPLSPRVPAVAAPAPGSVVRCPLPRQLDADAPPLPVPPMPGAHTPGGKDA